MSDGHNKETQHPVFDFFTQISILESLSKAKMESVLPNGMKASHFGVLNRLIRANEKESPADLANAFQVARPSMTNTIQKLEKKAYVTVAVDPQDGRGKLVALTTLGRKAHQEAVMALGQGFSQLSKDLGDELFVSVIPALQKIRKYLDSHRD